LVAATAVLIYVGRHNHASRARTSLATASPQLPLSGEWRPLHDAPAARQQVAGAVADGTIWIFGGLAGSTATAKTEAYDPAIDTWKSGPDLPLALHHEMAVDYKGELVVLGGWVPSGPSLTATTSDRVFALRGGAWVELPKLLRPRAAGATAVVGNLIVVTGGQAGGQLVPTTETFDGSHWREVAAMPTLREHLAAASDGRYLYTVGGRALSSDKNSAALERYDPDANRWEKLPDMPTPRGGLGAAVANGHLVALGGENPTDVYGVVESFDLSTRAWGALSPMRTPRHGMGVVAVGTAVYAIDGARRPTHTDPTPTAEVLAL
jgi:non-specific serine/threonine protein kinase